ncbi:MAG: hypothetical protein D6776_05895 [Planctomycetota bacterium]|nr:MAG: hypothetical protein D6776_05895 [Planctomycetota bacterium]
MLEREFFDVCGSEEDPEPWRFAAGREEHDPRWIHGGVWKVNPEQDARDAAVFGEIGDTDSEPEE